MTTYNTFWDLSTIPDQALTREYNKRVAAKRDPANLGRKKVLRPCPKCKKPFGARDLRQHIPACK